MIGWSVGGSAALYFDPRSPAQIAAAISELIADTGIAGRLREHFVAVTRYGEPR